MPINTQRTDRRRRRLTVRFRPTASDDPLRTGFTEDISPQGLFVQTVFVIPRGTKVEMEIDLENGTITRRGLVVWAKRSPAPLAKKKRCGMGIRLDEPCPELTAISEAG
jgi:hypothetical protein